MRIGPRFLVTLLALATLSGCSGNAQLVQSFQDELCATVKEAAASPQLTDLRGRPIERSGDLDKLLAACGLLPPDVQGIIFCERSSLGACSCQTAFECQVLADHCQGGYSGGGTHRGVGTGCRVESIRGARTIPGKLPGVS